MNEQNLDIPKDVISLFFRHPYEIVVIKKLEGGENAVKYIQQSSRFSWDKVKAVKIEALKC